MGSNGKGVVLDDQFLVLESECGVLISVSGGNVEFFSVPGCSMSSISAS